MEQLILKPKLYKFDSFKAFSEEFAVGEGDLILTNKVLYEYYFKWLDLNAVVIFQEEYGLGEPTDDMIEAISSNIYKRYERVIAVGGGTVLDIGKLLVLKNICPVEKLFTREVLSQKEKELVLIPTTCGTGSEMTNISIVMFNKKNTKMGLAMDELYADSAILIPEMLEGLPFQVFAASSIDALIHAVESLLSPKATSYTKIFSYKAIEMIITGFQEIERLGKESWSALSEDFLLASNYAGIAFGTAGCAAIHALSYPLSGKYHVPHGESNYVFFIKVLKTYFSVYKEGAIDELNAHIANLLGCDIQVVYSELGKLLDHILKKKSLSQYGVIREDLLEFTTTVMKNQQRLMRNSFVTLEEKDVLRIYESLYI